MFVREEKITVAIIHALADAIVNFLDIMNSCTKNVPAFTFF